MNKISHPIINDPKYGDNQHNYVFKTQFNTTKLFLHANQLSFTHPVTHKEITVDASFPVHWSALNQITEFEPLIS